MPAITLFKVGRDMIRLIHLSLLGVFLVVLSMAVIVADTSDADPSDITMSGTVSLSDGGETSGLKLIVTSWTATQIVDVTDGNYSVTLKSGEQYRIWAYKATTGNCAEYLYDEELIAGSENVTGHNIILQKYRKAILDGYTYYVYDNLNVATLISIDCVIFEKNDPDSDYYHMKPGQTFIIPESIEYQDNVYAVRYVGSGKVGGEWPTIPIVTFPYGDNREIVNNAYKSEGYDSIRIVFKSEVYLNDYALFAPRTDNVANFIENHNFDNPMNADVVFEKDVHFTQYVNDGGKIVLSHFALAELNTVNFEGLVWSGECTTSAGAWVLGGDTADKWNNTVNCSTFAYTREVKTISVAGVNPNATKHILTNGLFANNPIAGLENISFYIVCDSADDPGTKHNILVIHKIVGADNSAPLDWSNTNPDAVTAPDNTNRTAFFVKTDSPAKLSATYGGVTVNLYVNWIWTFTFMNGTETVSTVEFNVENMASKTMPEVPAKTGYAGSWDVTEFTLENKTVNAVYVKLVPVSEDGTADVTLSDGETSFIPAAGTKTVNVAIAADTSVKVEDAAGLADKVVVTKVDAVTNSTGIAGTAYEFTFTADGTVYNGKIQVTLPYTKEDGKEPVVYFWNGTESVKMKVISSTDTSVTFETDHNSMYVVASETSSKDDGGSFMLYLGIILVVGIVAAMLVGFTFYRKKA